MMPLMLAGIGEENTIKKIGGSPEIKKHLEDLGFVVGGSVTVVNALGGNVIVNVKESRVAISEEMARRIQKRVEMIFGRQIKLSEITEDQVDLFNLVVMDMRDLADES